MGTMTKKDIKQSVLNGVRLNELEETFASNKNSNSKRLISKKHVALISGLGTFLVFILTIGSVYGLYSLVFKSEDRLALIGLESESMKSIENISSSIDSSDSGNDNSGNSTPNTSDGNTTNINNTPNNGGSSGIIDISRPPSTDSSTNIYCSVGSEVPDGVCRSILSIQNDNTETNSLISLEVAKLTKLLPTGPEIIIREYTWVASSETQGSIVVEIYSQLGNFIVSGTLDLIDNNWIISTIEIEGNAE